MPRPAARPAHRLLSVVGCAALLAGCGSPPQPRPTAPPRAATESSGTSPGAPTLPPGGLPGTLPPGGVPTYPVPPGGLPPYPGAPGGLPTYPGAPGGLPTYPVPTRTTATTTPPAATPTTPRPTPAPRCTAGPTGQQVIDLVAGRPGIPDDDLTVTEGPYCAASWQFTIVGIAGTSDDDVEPLLVVSSGRPSAPRIVEAGADVCTTRVEQDAPPGIRVRACGS